MLLVTDERMMIDFFCANGGAEKKKEIEFNVFYFSYIFKAPFVNNYDCLCGKWMNRISLFYNLFNNLA
ncbi:MAG TPA: hypothetical protein PLI67_07245 [Niabella sp.]|nr:hypothetical protein [Niabella sp.]